MVDPATAVESGGGLIRLIASFNTLTPMAAVGLLIFVIILLVKGNKKVEAVASNHLHDMPELVDTMRRMDNTLQRIEVRLGEDFSWIKAKITDNDNPRRTR